MIPEVSKQSHQRPRLESLPIIAQGYVNEGPQPLSFPSSGLNSERSKHNSQTEGGEKPEMKECDNCNFKTSSIKELQSHIESVHKPSCSTCNKEFKSKDELLKHLDSGHKLTCKECDEELESETELNAHILNSHRIKCRFLVNEYHSCQREFQV